MFQYLDLTGALMGDGRDEARQGFPLAPPGHSFGVSCGADGPSLGPIRLLEKTDQGFAPRPEAELDAILGTIYGRPFSSARLMPGLAAAARALNQGQMARAMFSTQHLRLSSLLPHEVGRAFDILRKASPDDEKHPGWPKDTPDHKGGQFRPKFGTIASEAGKEVAEASRKVVVKNVEKAMARRAMWGVIRTATSPARLLRYAGELFAASTPLGEVIDFALMSKDIADAAKEYADLTAQGEQAADFIKGGPYTLEQLRATPEDISFSSFDAFKKTDTDDKAPVDKFAGPAGEGYEWHHIVEQGPNGQILDTADLQSTRNIIRLPKALHDIITSDYARIDNDIRTTFRKSLSGQSFDYQLQAGIGKLRNLRILKD